MENERKSIQRLPEEVVGKIAAGEVVESPAAAIKELIENSIDAGATNVTIETRDGGIAYFRVTDNGCGIPPEDIKMAFERHATSKIRTADELFDVQSLGFRGEALASIAAVAKVTLTSRAKGNDRGVKAVNIGGRFESIQDAGSPEGTTIVVQDLFFNTPARLKFLKKPATEGARVADMVLRMMLSNPTVGFRLVQNDKQVYHSPGDGKLASTVYSAYGREVSEKLFAVDGRDGGVHAWGVVGIGPIARGNRAQQSFFINGRYVRSVLLTQAVEAACRERVLVGQFPLCVLHLALPPTLVDVNVHPNKLEVRFSDEPLISACVQRIVRDALSQDPIASAPEIKLVREEVPLRPTAEVTAQQIAPPPPEMEQVRMSPPAPAHTPSPERFSDVAAGFFSQVASTPAKMSEHAYAPPPPPPEVAPPAFSSPVPPSSTEAPPFSVIGVAFRTYILVQQGDKLLLIDQHAAHERMLYEKLMRSLHEGGGSQQLLVPQVVKVTPAEHDKLTQYREAIEESGFEFDFFGDGAAQIRAVPIILGEPEAKHAFTAMLDQLGELRLLSTQQKRRDAIVQMACKRAIKGGDTLDNREIAALLAEMQDSDAPPTCPHGRPLVVVLTRTELEKRFRRIV